MIALTCMHLRFYPHLSFSPAGVDRAHGRWRKVGVVLNGDCLLHVVLADVLVHLLYGQWLPVLRNTTAA